MGLGVIGVSEEAKCRMGVIYVIIHFNFWTLVD